MRPLSKAQVQQILTRRLRLREPRFLLRRVGNRVSGSIVSESFRGKGDFRRQEMIRDALDAATGGQSFSAVGTLLAYTPDEWDVDAVTGANGHRARTA